MNLRYIYFDLDNTLLDHNEAESKSHKEIYSHFEVLRSVPFQSWLESDESEKIGISYIEKYRNYWGWVNKAEETLDLVSQKFGVGILTNGFKETQHKKLEKLAIYKYTSQMIISEELGVLKPHPKVFDYATQLAGVEREEILYVGDSYKSDVMGGLNAGWKTAWYTGIASKTEEDIQPDFVFDEFADLQQFLNLA